jgi:DNA repair exonuclease SbcCD ATPase subunit
MQIDSLSLRNFQYIKEAEFKFGPGFNLVVGDNGQGKSCIFRAISYLLLNYNPKTIEDLLNWDADEFSASMSVQHEGVKYSIKNLFDRKGNKTERSLRAGDELVKGTTPVNDRLASVFDPALCRASVVHFQGENDIVNATPTERRENLKRIYNLDFSSQVEALEKMAFDLEKANTQLEKEHYLLINKEYGYKVIPALPYSEEEYKGFAVKLALLLSEVEAHTRLKKEYDAKLDTRKKAVDQLSSLQVSRDKYETSITATKVKINEAETVLSGPSKTAGIEKEIEEYRASSESEMLSLDTQAKAIKLVRVPLFDEKALTDLASKRNDTVLEQRKLQNEIKAMESGECPVCGRPYDSSMVTETQAKLVAVTGTLKEIDESVKALETQRKENQDLKTEMTRLSQEKKHIEEKITTMSSTITSKLNDMQKLVDGEKELRKEKEASLKTNQSMLEEYKEMFLSTLSSIKTVEADIQKYDQDLSGGLPELKPVIKQEIDLYTKQIKDYETVIVLIDSYTEDNKKLAVEEALDKVKVKDLQKQKDTNSVDVETWKRGVVVFKKEFPNFILSQMTREIEDGMNLFLDEAYKGRYHAKIIETKSGLSIVYGSRDKEIGLSSGAEQSLFQLAMKMAFTKIAGLNVLILDEIDSYMSLPIAESIFTILNGLIEAGDLEQVFVITHNFEIKQLLSNTFGATVYELRDGKVA